VTKQDILRTEGSSGPYLIYKEKQHVTHKNTRQ